MTEHAQRAHAILSASGAERWINCPPSARLEENMPDTESAYSREGTLAHELAECSLHCNPNIRAKGDAWKEWHKKYGDIVRDMTDEQFKTFKHPLEDYTGMIEAKFLAARIKDKNAVILIERQLDLSRWAPKSFGTADVIIIANGVLEIIDLKFGTGIPVSAQGNTQMQMYGLGGYDAYGDLYDIEKVRMTICQPRISNEPSTAEMSVQELLEWGETVAKPKALLAWEGKGEIQPGKHCRWCKVGVQCRKRAEENLALEEMDFKNPDLLSIDEIGEVLKKGKLVAQWAKTVEDWIFDQIKENKLTVPGWKLVEGRSTRKISNLETATTLLMEAGFVEDEIFETKLAGLTALEKVVGKAKLTELLSDLIEKPPGAPTLVEESDARKEWRSADSDFDDLPKEVTSSLLD